MSYHADRCRKFTPREMRKSNYRFSKSRYGGRNILTNKECVDDNERWYKINIPHGAKCHKEYLLDSIQHLMAIPLRHFNYHTDGNHAVFFVKDPEIVEAIKVCSRRIYDKNGFALQIHTSRGTRPVPNINKDFEALIVEVIKNRYDYTQNYLNLSNFAEDAIFLRASLYVQLSRFSVFNLLLKKMSELTPNVHLLSLSNNKLISIQPLDSIHLHFKSLKALDLSMNKLSKINQLDFIKNLQLEELILEGNSFCGSFSTTDPSAYISAVRSRFPKLTKLDGKELPKAIGFETDETVSLPAPAESFIPSEIREFVAGFLEQYFSIYDSDDRSPLVAAYHDDALFSFSIARTDNKSNTFLKSLIDSSRNLLKVQEKSKRVEILHIGRTRILETLSKMPRTKHVANSLVVDVPCFNSSFYNVVVNGVYKEFTKKQMSTRAFCRNFLIVPHGQGFVIINDALLAMNATVEQVQKYGRTLDTLTISSRLRDDPSNTHIVGNIARLSLAGDGVASEVDRDTIIENFSLKTRMNRAFSKQCLEENGYNINKALEVFNLLNANNGIPPEAFVQ